MSVSPAWKHKFALEGPAGLLDHPRGSPTGNRLPEVTRRAIIMLKDSNPDWGCEHIAAILVRGPALLALESVKADDIMQRIAAPTQPSGGDVIGLGFAYPLPRRLFHTGPDPSWYAAPDHLRLRVRPLQLTN